MFSVSNMSTTLKVTGFCLLVVVVAGLPVEDCDKTKCSGPVKFYEDLNCKPVYAKEGDCCAVRYDCTHLDGKSRDKCHANGNDYEIGEELKDEDRSSPCDKCTCNHGYRGGAEFNCVVFDCFNQEVKEGCFFLSDGVSCCGGKEVCPKSPDERYKCEVDGETYMEGHQFNPKSNPGLTCTCREGYKGENVEPFCHTSKCNNDIRHFTDISQNCTPVFYPGESLIHNCFAVQFRCQNKRDEIIPSLKAVPSEDTSEEMKCKFGNMTLNIGDELKKSTHYDSVCVKCTCEVPPLPTCQQIQDCDYTDHPPFD